MPPLPEPQQHTIDAIYSAYQARREDGERTYLGMSAFGTGCDRALWYGFRWAHSPEQLDGRKVRLFATGEREEERLVADLRLAGVEIEDRDPATGEQWEVFGLGGHLRGHMDGRGLGFLEVPATVHLIEFKTHNDKSFKALVKDGVARSKPGHFAQMQLYMHFGGLARAFYLAHNKNTDELHAERIAYDPVAAARLVARASAIIESVRPPAKLHADPTAKAAYACGWCPAKGICHEREWSRVNCRTCLHVTPLTDGSDGSWHCERFDRLLSTEEQRQGCPAHRFIPDLVPGEQVDADVAAETVTYRLADGTAWIDGVTWNEARP